MLSMLGCENTMNEGVHEWVERSKSGFLSHTSNRICDQNNKFLRTTNIPSVALNSQNVESFAHLK
jgi:hypothetical protein